MLPTVRLAHQSSLVFPALQCARTFDAALTTMLNSSLTDPPLPSLAVTFTATVATSADAGMPEKARVPASNMSHVGSALLSGFAAV